MTIVKDWFQSLILREINLTEGKVATYRMQRHRLVSIPNSKGDQFNKIREYYSTVENIELVSIPNSKGDQFNNTNLPDKYLTPSSHVSIPNSKGDQFNLYKLAWQTIRRAYVSIPNSKGDQFNDSTSTQKGC